MIRMSDVQRIEQAPVPGPRRATSPSASWPASTATTRCSATRARKSLYESGDWHGIQRLSRERIEYYDMRVRECTAQLEGCAAPRRRGGPERADAANGKSAANGAGGADGKSAALDDAQTAFWQQVKQEFVGLLADHRQPECAETFFNSVSCRILHRDYFHNDFLFVRPAVATDYLDSSMPSYRVYTRWPTACRKA